METQLFIRNLRCSFNLRAPRSAKPTIIYLVTRIDGRQYKFSTGMKVYPAHWLRKQQRAVTDDKRLTRLDSANNHLANKRIELLAGRFEEFKQVLSGCPEEVSRAAERLREFLLTGRHRRSRTARLHEAFAMIYPPEETSEGTLRTNRSRLKQIDRFLERGAPGPLDQRFVDGFCEYLTERNTGVKQINECCGLLKRLINSIARLPAAGDSAVRVAFTAVKDRRRREDAKKDGLQEGELEAIRGVSLPQREDSFRRLFLLQTECGVRMSDLLAILESPLPAGGRCLTLTTRKEGIEATVFVSPEMRRLIEDYRAGRCPGLRMGQGFPAIYNKVLKRIARKAGLDREIHWKEQRGRRLVSFKAPLHEVISSHFARHTFITARVREGWNPDKLRFLTGHADDTMIKRVYTHLTADDRERLLLLEYRRLYPSADRITDSRTGWHRAPELE